MKTHLFIGAVATVTKNNIPLKYRFVCLFLFVFISTLRLYSQPYQSVFGKDSTSWATYIQHYDGSFTEQFFCYNEDSIINSVKYKIVYEHDRSNPTFLLSEDTMTGELWMKQRNEEDKLLMTLSLDVGDSFVTYRFGRPDITYHVVAVFKDSLNRKVIQFDQKHRHSSLINGLNTPDSNIMFIEGVGPSTGISISSLISSDDELLCMYKDEEKTYTNLYYQGVCFMQYGRAAEYTKQHPIKVYPNPVKDKFYIEQDNGSTAMNWVKIYDIQGKLQLSVKTTNDAEIDVSFLKPGIYFLCPEYGLNINTKPLKLIKQ